MNKYYVAGFFDADGHIPKDKLRVILTNTNRDLLEYISIFLEAKNIKHNLRERKFREENHSTAYDIFIDGWKNVIKFYKEIPFIHPKKKERLEYLLNNTKHFPSLSELEKL